MTFYLVFASPETGPKDRVCCAKCFADSTVRATEIEPDPNADEPLRCSHCGVTA